MKKRVLIVIITLATYLTSSLPIMGNTDQMIYSRDNPLYILVNKQNGLGKDYRPVSLVIPDVVFLEKGHLEKKHMTSIAAYHLKRMFDEAARQNIHLVAISGYRSYNRQHVIYNTNIRKYGQAYTDKISARPGFSEHQTGLAMDVSAKSAGYGLTQKFANTKEGKWLAENAQRYGFIIRYPKGKEKITGYIYEPWHIRYVGQELASYLYINNLTLEEMEPFFKQSQNEGTIPLAKSLETDMPISIESPRESQQVLEESIEVEDYIGQKQ